MGTGQATLAIFYDFAAAATAVGATAVAGGGYRVPEANASGGRVEPSRPSGVIPLRPLTFGELLDAAVALLRTHFRLFPSAALCLAAAEQALLYPIRQWADIYPPFYLPYSDRLGPFWVVLSTGFGTEAAILALLGGLTGISAAATFSGVELRGRAVLRGALRRLAPLVVIAVAAGLLVGLAASALFLPWLLLFGMVGLAGPALVVERVGPFRALGRSFRMSLRGARAFWLRLGAYLTWLAIRLALGIGGLALLNLVLPASRDWRTAISVVTWLLVDTVAYATLACFDAVLYLDTRMRTEGLDITVSRQLRRRVPVELAVQR